MPKVSIYSRNMHLYTVTDVTDVGGHVLRSYSNIRMCRVK